MPFPQEMDSHFTQAIFAAAAGPYTSFKSHLETIFWIWLHLLQFNVSNQSLDPEEDAHNKPHRPIPSKRISWKNARILRWTLIPICIGYSAMYSFSVSLASIAFVIGTITYDDIGAHASHWFIRGCSNAFNLGCLEVGATLIAGQILSRHLR